MNTPEEPLDENNKENLIDSTDSDLDFEIDENDFENHIDDFINRGIFDITGIDFNEFLGE